MSAVGGLFLEVVGRKMVEYKLLLHHTPSMASRNGPILMLYVNKPNFFLFFKVFYEKVSK